MDQPPHSNGGVLRVRRRDPAHARHRDERRASTLITYEAPTASRHHGNRHARHTAHLRTEISSEGEDDSEMRIHQHHNTCPLPCRLCRIEYVSRQAA